MCKLKYLILTVQRFLLGITFASARNCRESWDWAPLSTGNSQNEVPWTIWVTDHHSNVVIMDNGKIRLGHTLGMNFDTLGTSWPWFGTVWKQLWTVWVWSSDRCYIDFCVMSAHLTTPLWSLAVSLKYWIGLRTVKKTDQECPWNALEFTINLAQTQAEYLPQSQCIDKQSVLALHVSISYTYNGTLLSLAKALVFEDAAKSLELWYPCHRTSFYPTIHIQHFANDAMFELFEFPWFENITVFNLSGLFDLQPAACTHQTTPLYRYLPFGMRFCNGTTTELLANRIAVSSTLWLTMCNFRLWFDLDWSIHISQYILIFNLYFETEFNL